MCFFFLKTGTNTNYLKHFLQVFSNWDACTLNVFLMHLSGKMEVFDYV